MNIIQFKNTQSNVCKEEVLIQSALLCLERRVKYNSSPFKNPDDVCAYLRLQLGSEENEIFGALFLNNAHQLIAFEKLFCGTINEAKIHPRIVVKKAMALNAAAIIFSHNHPSGDVTPSAADISMTKTLKDVLSIIDVRTLDHIIVSPKDSYSFAEHNLL